MSFIHTLIMGLTLWSHCLQERGVFSSHVYPENTLFEKTDFFLYGCKTFLNLCPRVYKEQPVCARSYSGHYKEFNNYCEMEYENCNTWKNYHVYKREKC